jgi:ABC-type dipeptide/oligopeptide/nickel transport system permease component
MFDRAAAVHRFSERGMDVFLLRRLLTLLATLFGANHNKLGDVGVMSLTQIGIALPNFWFAISLILLFSVKLQWLSVDGFEGWQDGIWAGVHSLLLPAISLLGRVDSNRYAERFRSEAKQCRQHAERAANPNDMI